MGRERVGSVSSIFSVGSNGRERGWSNGSVLSVGSERGSVRGIRWAREQRVEREGRMGRVYQGMKG